MISILISYSARDKGLAKRIADDLKSRSLEVWLDEWEIHVGHSISQMIERGLEKADFVAVLLTKHSVKSGWVEKEWQAKIGEEATKRKVVILPLRGEHCRMPFLLRDKKYADFAKDYQSALNQLLNAIKVHTGARSPASQSKPTSPVERIEKLTVGSISLPCFFPSISGSAKNVLSPLEHLKILVAMSCPHFLISAYDIFHSTRKDRLNIQRLLEKAISRGGVVLMDSGLYEKRWLRAKSWLKKDFHGTLRSTPCHLAFCYDNLSPKGSNDEIARDLIRSVAMDKRRGDMNAINPLIHARKPADFPFICSQVADQLDPVMVAVPERELGESVLTIAQTVRAIRKALNQNGQYYPVHIVGAGNPLSILIYAACGADSFDGLDWCQTVVDHTTGRLHHSLQLDFFAHQTPYGSEGKITYLARALGHNLLFYLRWMEEIRRSIKEGNIAEMIAEFIPSEVHSRLQELLPGNSKPKAQKTGRKRR